MGDPPRIHTLRSDGQVPRTSDCFTPRTMESSDGAFKTPVYGAWIEGPYRRGSVWIGRILWAGVVVLALAAVLVVYLKV
jgi:hypothetical protein